MRLWFILLLGGFLIGCGIFIHGKNLPETYTTSQTVTYDRPIDTAWEILTNYAAAPKWSSQINKAEKLADIGGHNVWRLTKKDNTQFEVQTNSAQKPFQQLNRIIKSNIAYNGSWNLDLTEQGKRTKVVLTENITIASPWKRLQARYLSPQKTIMQQYLADAEQAIKTRPNIPAEYP